MKNLLLPVLFVVLTGCAAHAHTSPATRTIYVTPPPHTAQTTRVVIKPVIRYHYVYVNQRWVRRTGAPPAHVRHHRHPTQSHTVIVHRSTGNNHHQRNHHKRGKVVKRSTR